MPKVYYDYKRLIRSVQRFNREFDFAKIRIVITTNWFICESVDGEVEVFRVRHSNLEEAIQTLDHFRLAGYLIEYSEVAPLLPKHYRINRKCVSNKMIRLWKQMNQKVTRREQSSRL